MDEKSIERIQSLPPEPFNQIQEEVFECDEDSRQDTEATSFRNIAAAYRFPKQFHINHYYREKLSKSYFTDAVLIFSSAETFRRFMLAMDEEHLAIINRCRVFYGDESEHGVLLFTKDQLEKRMITWPGFELGGYFMLKRLSGLLQGRPCSESPEGNFYLLVNFTGKGDREVVF